MRIFRDTHETIKTDPNNVFNILIKISFMSDSITRAWQPLINHDTALYRDLVNAIASLPKWFCVDFIN